MLSVDAVIDEIYFKIVGGSPSRSESLIFEGKFTGSVNLQYADFKTDGVVGINKSANLSGAHILINGEDVYAPQLKGNEVYISEADTFGTDTTTTTIIPVCAIGTVIAIGVVVTIVIIIKRKKAKQAV